MKAPIRSRLRISVLVLGVAAGVACTDVALAAPGVAHAETASSTSATPASASPALNTPTMIASAIGAAAPSDQLHDPVSDPDSAYGDLVAAQQSGGWALALLGALVMLTRILARLPGTIGAWLRRGVRATAVASVSALAIAAFDTLALGGTWPAVAFAVLGTVLALLVPSVTPQSLVTSSAG